MDEHSSKPPAGISITPMHADHLGDLADMESAAFSRPWSYDSLAEELQNPLAVFYVAEDVEAESAVGMSACIIFWTKGISPIWSSTPAAGGRESLPP